MSSELTRSGRKRAREAEKERKSKSEEKIEAALSSESDEDMDEDGAGDDEKNKKYSDSESDSDNDDSENDDGSESEASASSVSSDEEDDPLVEPSFKTSNKYQNKQRCLVLTSRGVTSRYRHLLEDIRTLLPHHKKDSKLDDKQSIGSTLKEICEVKSCNTCVFLECRKRQDAYLWIGAAPNGPSAKFYVANVHTMDELKLTGNCMQGSRPLLQFSADFDTVPHLTLCKHIFIDVFGTPRGHPKSKPFVDRIMGFYFVDNKIWVRNYQIVEEEVENAKERRARKAGVKSTLVEIGPRFVLSTIRIFAGAFGGQTLYQNPSFVSPNTVRSQNAMDRGGYYKNRKDQEVKRKKRKEILEQNVRKNPLDDVFM